MYSILKYFLFKNPPEKAHYLTFNLLKIGKWIPLFYPIMRLITRFFWPPIARDQFPKF